MGILCVQPACDMPPFCRGREVKEPERAFGVEAMKKR
jgi:hypothetical protein